MTKEKAKNVVRGITDKIEATTDIDDWAEYWGFTRDDYEEFLEMSIKLLEQKPTQLTETPKDYVYDTETKDFFVYRNKYTGDEIHIRKPISVYILKQKPILDKIRAEIEGLTYYCCEVHPRNVIDDVLNIIDKYKAEMESKK